MKILVLILIVFCKFSEVYSQDTAEYIYRPTYEGFKQWSSKGIVPRVGIGAQKAFYTELGLARHQYQWSDLGFFAHSYYLSGEWTPSIKGNVERSLYAIKAGYEFNSFGWIIGLESKFQTNWKVNDVVITPKIGIGILDVMNIFYGYNISLHKNPFDGLGRHQFSFVVNCRAIDL